MLALAGYAAPFGQVAQVDGAYEFINPRAFDAFLAKRPAVYVAIGSHSEPAAAWCSEIRADSYGLAFAVEGGFRQTAALHYAIARQRFTRCSVNLTRFAVRAAMRDGRECREIVEAEIDHIAICDRPAYANTGIWPASGVAAGDLDPRCAALAARWAGGRATAEARRRARLDAPLAQPITASAAPHRRPPPSAAVVASDAKYFGVIV
jgi:HK97 family phage prohead protease